MSRAPPTTLAPGTGKEIFSLSRFSGLRHSALAPIPVTALPLLPPSRPLLQLCSGAAPLEIPVLCHEINLEVRDGEERPQPPKTVTLIPAGERIEGRDGRSWVFNAEDVLARTLESEADPPIDVNHATALQARQGKPSPAVAWLKNLRVENGALMGDPEWNGQGAWLLMSREYRYLSPAFTTDGDSVGRLVSAGLTNVPNLRLPALNTEGHVDGKGKNNKTGSAGVEQGTTGTQPGSEAAAPEVDLNQFVPRSDYEAMRQQAEAAKAELANRAKSEHEAAVNAAITDALERGVITPASEKVHRNSCKTPEGLTDFLEFVGKGQPVIPDSGLEGRRPESAPALNAQEAKVAAMFGNTAEDLQNHASA